MSDGSRYFCPSSLVGLYRRGASLSSILNDKMTLSDKKARSDVVLCLLSLFPPAAKKTLLKSLWYHGVSFFSFQSLFVPYCIITVSFFVPPGNHVHRKKSDLLRQGPTDSYASHLSCHDSFPPVYLAPLRYKLLARPAPFPQRNKLPCPWEGGGTGAGLAPSTLSFFSFLFSPRLGNDLIPRSFFFFPRQGERVSGTMPLPTPEELFSVLACSQVIPIVEAFEDANLWNKGLGIRAWVRMFFVCSRFSNFAHGRFPNLSRRELWETASPNELGLFPLVF